MEVLLGLGSLPKTFRRYELEPSLVFDDTSQDSCCLLPDTVRRQERYSSPLQTLLVSACFLVGTVPFHFPQQTLSELGLGGGDSSQVVP